MIAEFSRWSSVLLLSLSLLSTQQEIEVLEVKIVLKRKCPGLVRGLRFLASSNFLSTSSPARQFTTRHSGLRLRLLVSMYLQDAIHSV